MLRKKLISFLMATAVIASLFTFNGYDVQQKASASTQTSSVLDTPFQTTTDGSAKVTINGLKFMVGDKELWFNGANTPWQNWNDFGADNGQGKSKFDVNFWDKHFEEMHKNGINATRVWISCNGDVGMNIAEDGTFNGPTELFWQDLDTYVKLAEKHQIYIMATVQSFDHYKNSHTTFESYRKMIKDDKKTQQYIDKYIVPLVKRYDSSDYFWSVDLCNEPDWIYENAESGKIDWKYLSNYYAKAAAAIHKNSDVMVTVGMGIVKYNSDAYEKNVISDKYLQSFTNDKDSYVDFYSTHWYSWEKQWFGFPFDKSPVEFKLDGTKPCVIGECAATTNKDDTVTLVDKYRMAYENGWNGVFAWKTSGSDDGCGLLPQIIPATKAMLDIAGGKIFPLTSTLKSISDYQVQLSQDAYDYTGAPVTVTATVTDGTNTLVYGKDYNITYKNNILPGTASATIYGIKDYSGSIAKTFTIALGAPEVTVTAGTKKATVKWNKMKAVSGYEVYMAKSESGKYTLIKDADSSTKSFTKKSLVKGKTYYFKVRAYVEDNGIAIYGSYSTVCSVKVK